MVDGDVAIQISLFAVNLFEDHDIKLDQNFCL